MKILAIEFASERRSVALVENGRVLGRAEETGGRNARAFALIEQALTQAGWQREDIERIAIGLGPGSYAGIRGAIALAQGWEVARGISLVGINTVECLAAQAVAEGITGHITIAIDAQRNEFYCATYEITNGTASCVEPLRIVSLETVQQSKDTVLLWPDLQTRLPQGRVLLPDAATLGLLAEKEMQTTPGWELAPVYLREVNFVKAPPPRVIPRLSKEASR